MNGKNRLEIGLTCGVLVLGGALLLTGNALLESGASPGRTPGPAELVGMAIAAFGTLVVAWWAFSFCFAVVSAVLFSMGRHITANRFGAVSPLFMKRTAYLALGLNLLAAPSAYAHGVQAPSSTVIEHMEASEGAHFNPQWEVTGVEVTEVLAPIWTPMPLPASGSLLVKEAREAQPAHGRGTEIVVQPGDSLWTIAARDLGIGASDASVAEAWPRWYAENKGVIGDRPDVLLPGQILHAPSSTGSK